MAPFQIWLVHWLDSNPPVAAFMRTAWGWPAMESVHFVALCFMVGTIVVFDMRLLGMARRIPISALHRLIPFGLAGYALTFISGMAFLLTEPDQYIYNPAFHFKVLFMALAGFNALAFYALAWNRVKRQEANGGVAENIPRAAKIIAAISLCLWMAVIVSGRMLTFYRPGDCGPSGPGVIAECIP